MFTGTDGRGLANGLDETARAMLADFLELDEADAQAAPDADEWAIREGEDWSVKQLVAHVSEIERDLVTEAMGIVGKPGLTVGKPAGTFWGEAQGHANDRPLSQIMEEFETVHAWTLEQIEALTDDDLTSAATHRGSGPTTVLTMLTGVVGHRRMHNFQGRSNLISLRGRREGRSPAEAYSVTGDGDTAIMLVDAPTSRWAPAAEALAAEGYRVVQHHFAACSSDIERLRDELEIGELWIGGTGSGAVDACKYAIMHADQIAGLLMANMPALPFHRDRPDDFSAVTVPALTLIGADHPQRDRVQERAGEFAASRVVVIDEAGRDLPGEQPEAVAGAIRDFLTAPARG